MCALSLRAGLPFPFHVCSWAPDPHHPCTLCHSCSRSLDVVLPLHGLPPFGVFAGLVPMPGIPVPHFLPPSYSSNSPPLWHLSPLLITSTNKATYTHYTHCRSMVHSGNIFLLLSTPNFKSLCFYLVSISVPGIWSHVKSLLAFDFASPQGEGSLLDYSSL